LGVVEDVQGKRRNCDAKEGSSLEHEEHSKGSEDPDDYFGDSEPGDSLNLVLLLQLTDRVVENCLGSLLLFIVLVVCLFLLVHIYRFLPSNFVLDAINLAFQETERGSELIDENAHLMQNTSVVLDLADKHVDFRVPLEDLVLNVRNLDA